MVVAVVVCLSLVCAGLRAGPACAAEEEGKRVEEKAKSDIWDVREESRFFGIERSAGDLGCTPSTTILLLDLAGSTFPDDVFSSDTTRLRVGGTDPTTDTGIPGRSSPRASSPGGGRRLSTFSVIGTFP
jgi:hypothetical protein